MWAIAERDGRPAEYRWHPLFNAESVLFIIKNTCRTKRSLSAAFQSLSDSIADGSV